MSVPPEKIGKYDVLEVLGKGSMGVVYKGHDAFVDRPVAIKVSTTLGPGDDADDLARRMFVNEARSAGRLDHPNILKVYEAGEDQFGQPYMVMEYVAGGETLKDYTSAEKLLPIQAALKLIQQAADALDYAHEHEVMHRDIKPANIMVTKEGRAKLGDFGIARRLGVDQTQIHGWFGSPLYMSPEQARDEQLTPQSDLFSLGAVFYELLTGTPPFVAKGLTGVIAKVTKEDPTPPSQLRSEVPEAVDRIVMRMLSKLLTERYRTGGEIVADVERVLLELSQSGLSLTNDQKLELLKELKFFKSFSVPELKEIVKVARWEQFEPERPVFEEGGQDGGFFVIVSGAAELVIGKTTVATLEEGECFGEMSYLSGQKRLGTIIPKRAMRAICIDKPLKEWASLPCQLRIKGVFQETLIERLARAYRDLSRG